MSRTNSGRKRKETGFVYPKGSPYCDAEGSSHLISCMNDAIINAAQRIGRKKINLELYRQCPPRRMKDT